MKGSLSLNSSRSEELNEEMSSCLRAGVSRKVGTANASSSFVKDEAGSGFGNGVDRLLLVWVGLHMLLQCVLID